MSYNILESARKKKNIQTKIRNINILPLFIGLNFKKYNGKLYKAILIKKTMLGFKVGSFFPTRQKNRNKILFSQKKKIKKVIII